MKVICNNAKKCKGKECSHITEHEPKLFSGCSRVCYEDGANLNCFDGMGCGSKCGQPRKCVPIFTELVREVLKKNGIQ